MYRIELSPGEETVFRSIEELAVAIKRGVVTPRARIYHNASSKWLPIQFHPHYKTALSMPLTQSALVAGPTAKPPSTLRLDSAAPADPQPAPAPASVAPASALPLPAPLAAAARALSAEPKAAAESKAPESKTAEPEAAPEQPRKKKAAKQKPATEKRSRTQGKQRGQLRIALIAALLLGGAQWVLSEPLFSRTDVAGLFRTHRRLVVAPANTAAVIPVIPVQEKPAVPSFGGGGKGTILPSAPKPSRLPDTAPSEEVEPAPLSIDVSAPRAPAMDSLARSRNDDSVDQRAIKGILRAVTGTSSKETAPRHR